MNKKWKEKYDIQINEKSIKKGKNKNNNEEYNITSEEINKKFHTGELASKIISNMKFKNEYEIEKFINPKRNDFYNPYLMIDMEKAVDRIEIALKKDEKITIFGDYDADGITSTTILKRFFKDLGKDCDTYIPNRLNEGYGLNKKAIKKIADKETKLIITVDCGITAIEETEYAKNLGIDVIITDHHEPGEKIPNAIAVIDCKRKESTYPFRELAGCGVAFKLIQALCNRLDLNENKALKYLDIACVGTISDVVPLIDENRVIAKLGMLLLKQTKNLGLKNIINNAHFKELNSTSISFGITPRINACGRLGHQDEALELFTTDDEQKAIELANKVNFYNEQRQSEEKIIYDEAIKILQKENSKEKCIVLGKENWNPGIIGIVSSKVTEKYYKPSILICFDKEVAKGSARSIKGFDLHKALMECSEHLTNYGGHSLAAGLSLNTKDFDKFKKEIENYAIQNIKDEDLIPTIDIDLEINEKYINIENVEKLELLEPFGQSNEEPIFMYKNLEIISIRTLSEEKHLKLYLKDSNKTNFFIDAIGFNLGDRAKEIKIGEKIDIVGNLKINIFNGTKKIQFNIKDFKISK